VFQFPVIYDTMTVAENLAFPLRNRNVPKEQIKKRVGEIAEMLEMSDQLNHRASGLAADAKQKISLGRGLVRPDVAAVLFDEPLTVIDPHLKWQLRRKLKQIHHELKLTLIYVTHDQVEALTFAQQVVVMTRGRAVQVGSAADLFEQPSHTFVGHFIGSPGMNFLSGKVDGDGFHIDGMTLDLPAGRELPAGEIKLGIRPEYVSVVPANTAGALPMTVSRVLDVGTHVMLSAPTARITLKARLSSDSRPCGRRFGLAAGHGRSHLLSTRMRRSYDERHDQTSKPESLVSDPACADLRRLLGNHAADDGRQLLGAGHHFADAAGLCRHRMVLGHHARRGTARRAASADHLLAGGSRRRIAARHHAGAGDAGAGLEVVGGAGDRLAVAADPVERRRHHLADLRPRRHRSARCRTCNGWASTTATPATLSMPGSPCW
jgi:ABC-type sugar transport system ATPase subunit